MISQENARRLRATRRHGATCRVALVAAALALAPGAPHAAEEDPEASARRRTLDINEYQIEGVEHLTQLEVEAALLPYVGPARSLEDVEKARVALERAYSDKGYQAVTVSIPQQKVRGGVVTLRVTEGTVGRLRVRGARYFSLAEVKREAPSVAEGKVPNFNDLVSDVAVLNQIPDRRVTPALRAGSLPNTVDVDLNVTDRLPIHGSLEFSNRFSAGTSPQRLNGAIHYDNLWQRGHSLSFSFQTAPNKPSDAKVFSLTYVARFLDVPWLSATANGVLQDSDVSTLGGLAVQGRGRIGGVRVTAALPGESFLSHSVSAGLDYKHFGKEIEADANSVPISYVPGSLQYAAALQGKKWQTLLTVTGTYNLRPLSSSEAEFDARRYQGSASFFHARLDLAHTQDLGEGVQLFGRLQGLYSRDPLVPAEQMTLGGVESVRGYLEAQAAGDRVGAGGVEVRSPSLARWIPGAGGFIDEWRLHAFFEGGRAAIREPLPEQKWETWLWSTGGGTRIRVAGHLSGNLDVGVPLKTDGSITRYVPRFQFRVASEF